MWDDFRTSVRAARASLTDAKRALGVEISTYPTPISGCDAQFNHLLAERQKVMDALRSLDTAVFVPTPRTPTEGGGVESR